MLKLNFKQSFKLIKSKILNKYNNINHGFFNRTGGNSKGIYKSLNCGTGSQDKKKNVQKNLDIVCKKIGCNKNHLILLNQMHSSKVFYLNKNRKKKIKGDGLITNKSGIALGILTADCAPLLFYDPKQKIIGAAHAGWRGAYKKISKKIINIFEEKGSSAKDINAIIGPCITQNNYEIKNDFKRKFIKQNQKNRLYFKLIKNKIFFSLQDYIANQLTNLGIKKLEIIKKDTYNLKNNFFSSRRSFKEKNHDYGRNISIIMIK